MTSTDFTNLYIFLVYLSGPMGTGFWMHSVSTVIRNWSEADPQTLDSGVAVWVHNLSSFARLIFTALVSISVPLIAGLVLLFVPPQWLVAAQPVFALIASILIVYFVQQGVFQVTKSNTPPAGTITATTTADKATMTVAPGTITVPEGTNSAAIRREVGRQIGDILSGPDPKSLGPVG